MFLNKIHYISDTLILVPLQEDCTSEADLCRILNARNHEEIRHNFINSSIIELQDHIQWFKMYCKDKHQFIYSIYFRGNYAGQVSLYNFHPSNSSFEIGRLFIIPIYRGNRLMKKCINYLLAICKKMGIGYIYLNCKNNNRAAISLYESIGFQLVREANHKDQTCMYTYTLNSQ